MSCVVYWGEIRCVVYWGKISCVVYGGKIRCLDFYPGAAAIKVDQSVRQSVCVVARVEKNKSLNIYHLKKCLNENF